jgi:hypothetical protein
MLKYSLAHTMVTLQNKGFQRCDVNRIQPDLQEFIPYLREITTITY